MGPLDDHREVQDAERGIARDTLILCVDFASAILLFPARRMALSDCKCVPRQMGQNASIRPRSLRNSHYSECSVTFGLTIRRGNIYRLC